MVNLLNLGTSLAGMETQLMQWMQSKTDKYEFKIFFPTHRPIPANRHQIVRDFLKGDWDYLVMLDDDTMCTKNIFDLLDYDKPVIGGVYPGRNEEGLMFHVYKMFKDENGETRFKQYPPEEREGLKKVDAVATGMMCIKREVLEKMRDAGLHPFEEIFHKEDGTFYYSDDMGFCMKCRDLGIDVWAHFDYLGSHWKEVDLLWVANLVAYAAATGKTNFPREQKK